MYLALFVLIFACGGLLAYRGIAGRRIALAAAGICLCLFGVFFYWFLGFWGEMLWFRQLGHSSRFWTVVLARVGAAVAGGALGLVVVALLTLPLAGRRESVKRWPEVAGAALGALSGASKWQTILFFLHRTSTSMTDPILGRDTGFYLFALPFYDALHRLGVALAVVALIGSAAALFVERRGESLELIWPEEVEKRSAGIYKPLFVCGSALLLLFAAGEVLSVFHLLQSSYGVVRGAGWTDVHVRMPALKITAAVAVAGGIFLLIPPLHRRLRARLGRTRLTSDMASLATLGVPAGVVAATWLLGVKIAPALLQWVWVEPNEITMEKPYISHNIRFTRHAFGLDRIEEKEFPVSEQFTREMAHRNERLLSEVRLWDWRALIDVYKQFQEIRLYYEFSDVDIDRYHFGEKKYRQVMISAREMELNNLPAQSQTFVNERFKYTHGYGVAMSTVSDFTSEGLPRLLIKDIPPRATYTELEIDRPQIYYGELTRTPAVVNTEEEEFDYPSGDQNVYIRYPGDGGVPLTLWRKFVFGAMFDGTRFLFSGYPTGESRVMFHRQVRERVRHLAPFLTFEEDPYIVCAEGKLYWIIDAYTTSADFPYSETFLSYNDLRRRPRQRSLTGSTAQFRGRNYVRNSVKAVVDAFDGEVSFYVFEEKDPLIQVWRSIFPGLFLPKEDMPPSLRRHVRYPESLVLVQGLVYAKYHMDDPAVFYNQEDLWVRGTEKYYSSVQPVAPYYIMWELPESAAPEFVLILPFTPKNKQVLIGWIAGMCDGDNYGRLLAYKFPKEKRVLGPQQVETKIDQDSFLSGQLTLWDQRGSNVIRGNVLAIPVEDTLLYVEPIYLQAETAAYPELRLVAVMHNDDLSYAETFDEAIQGLFEEEEESRRALPAQAQSSAELARRANSAFEAYLRLQGEGEFREAAEELETLQDTLEEWMKRGGRARGRQEGLPDDAGAAPRRNGD